MKYCKWIHKIIYPQTLIICSRIVVSLVSCHQTWIYSNLLEKGAINLSKISVHISYLVTAMYN